jgi:hypothetical protein
MKRWIPVSISKKNCYFRSFVAKPKNNAVFAFTYVLESFALFYGNFCIDLYSVDSDEARRWSVKRFIASIFKQR